MNDRAQLSNLASALRQVGLQLPTAKALPAIKKPHATAEDVLTAILESEEPNPYADPRVIATVTECQARDLADFQMLHEIKQAEANAAEVRAQHANLNTKLRELFAEHAATIETAAKTLGTMKDPARINLSTASTSTARAAMDLMPALASLDRVIAAWGSLHQFKSGHAIDSRAKQFAYTNPTPEQWEALREEPSPWEAARQGIALDLADTPREAGNRRTELMKTRQRQRDALEASVPGYLGW